jgi:hypothetical protein
LGNLGEVKVNLISFARLCPFRLKLCAARAEKGLGALRRSQVAPATGNSRWTPEPGRSHQSKGISMERRHLGIALLVIASVSQAALADFGGLAIAGRTGTLGFGGELMVNFLPNINGRAGITFFPLSLSGRISDVDYNFDLRMLTFPLTLDWYPFKGSFHVSGGIIVNETKVGLDTRSNASLTLGGTTYSASQLGQVSGDATYNRIAPYVGIGWGNAFGKEKRWGILSDLGVAFIGSPHVSVTATGPIATDPTFQTNLTHEEEDIRHEFGRLQIYPVISASLFYRF